MPIYDQGYESYAGARTSRMSRWVPLLREEVLPYTKKRIFILVIMLTLAPWIILGIGPTFLRTQVGNAYWPPSMNSQLPPMNETLIARILTNEWSVLMLVIISVWVGSGLIARDRKERTMEVFLGRALGPAQYLWSKGAALGVFLLGTTLVPLIIVMIFQVGLTGDMSFLWHHIRIIWGTLLYSVGGLGAFILFILALSSLGENPRVVGLILVLILFFGPSVSSILWINTQKPIVWIFSPIDELRALASHCLGVKTIYPISSFHSVAFFGVLALLSLIILTLRFYRREILR